MSSGGVFSETLQIVTSTKLLELSKKRNNFEDRKNALKFKLSREPVQRRKLQLLLDGVQECFSIQPSSITRKRPRARTEVPQLEVLINNLERFFAQSEYDTSISPNLMGKWERSLLQQLDIQSSKYEYATLYGTLVTEWLSSEQDAPAEETSDTAEGFEKVKRESAARTAGRAQWENLVFEPFETDQVAISTYLRSLFGNDGNNRQALKALDALRKSVEAFEIALVAPGQFDESVLRWTIDGLVASGLLSEEKCAALKDFLASPVILNEVADVLNMRIAALDTWRWEMDLAVEQRRHLNGTHHMFIEEDLLQALFLQYIGVKWSVFFKRVFKEFLNFEGAWAQLGRSISATEKSRRNYFLNQRSQQQSVQSKRQALYKHIYFMSQLPDSESQDKGEVDGDEEVQYASAMPMPMQMQRRSMRKVLSRAPPNAGMVPQPTGYAAYADHNMGYNDREEIPKNPPKTQMERKQFLLHLLSTEIIINTHLHEEFTCSRSEFDSWNPSLPHSTIFCVLEFFGLSQTWIKFFKNFLEAPLKFLDDGPSTEARIRKRGVPGAHALSSVCGEVILFCLDYAVNQKTDGAQLYRMHDDFWIWSPQHETVVKGWEAIVNFSEIMGVALNKNKTGTVRITSDNIKSGKEASISPVLPTGEIRWGFLRLSSTTGRFMIDQTIVKEHVSELQTQLLNQKSVFAWIKAWNTYAGRFFSSNFGKSANCFGRQHVDAMLSTFQNIQRQIFTDTNVIMHLKDTLKSRFNVEDIPEGYFYFPTSLGGLDLRNPFIGLLQLRDSVVENPEELIEDFFVAEQETYRKAKIAWLNGIRSLTGNPFDRSNLIQPSFDKPKEFMSYEEYILGREDFKSSSMEEEEDLYKVFGRLLEQPGAETVELDFMDEYALNGVVAEDMDDGYWRWVVKLYGEEMKDKFGGLSVVDKGLLPIGMVNLFRSGRVKWQG